MKLDNHVNNNLNNLTAAGNTVIENQAKSVCATLAFDNINSTGKENIAFYSYPAGTAFQYGANISSGDSKDVGSDGWLYVSAWADQTVSTTKPAFLSIHDSNNLLGQYAECTVAKRFFHICMPVPKGHSVKVYFANISNVDTGSTGGSNKHPYQIGLVRVGGV